MSSEAIAGLALAFTVATAITGLLWRTAARFGALMTRIEDNAEQMRRVADDLDKHLLWHLGQPRRDGGHQSRSATDE